MPALTFQLLYCLLSLNTGVAEFCTSNVTSSPTSEWVVQQLREALNADVTQFLTSTGLTPKRTSVQAPWQNGLAERWIGSCRRELLDQVIP